MMRAARTVVLLAGLAALGGCGQDWWTSNLLKVKGLPHDGAIATNADVRLVHRFSGYEDVPAVDAQGKPVTLQQTKIDRNGIAHPHNEPFYVRSPRDFLCAEPSPDIAKAVQAAMSLSGSISGSGAPAAGASPIEAQAALQSNASRSESVAQLTKRIATIQLLRDGLYRACEAYANGAIGPEVYSAIISRYDRMMITMLLGEMAAGNFGSAAILGGNAAAQASADASVGANGRVANALRQQEVLRKEQAAAQNEYDIADAKVQSETEVLNQETDPEKKATRTAQLELLKADRDRKKNRLDQVKQEKANADEEVKLAQEAAKQAGGPFASARGRTESVGGAGIVDSPAAASVEIAEVLARMQRSYLNDPPLHTVLMMCFSELASPKPIGRILGKECKDIFNALHSKSMLRDILKASGQIQSTELSNDRLKALGQALRGLVATGATNNAAAARALASEGGVKLPTAPQPPTKPSSGAGG